MDDTQIARVCYAAVRQLRGEQGGDRGPVWELLADSERGWYRRAVSRARMGLVPSQIHGGWREDLEEAGWKPGSQVDHAARTHPCLAPWDSLSRAQQLHFALLQMVCTTLAIGVPLSPASGLASGAQ